MSIRERDLTAYSEPIRMVDDATTDFDAIDAALRSVSATFGAELKVWKDDVERGMFDMNPVPCLMLCHPEHKEDYFRFCITRKVQGKTCLIQIYTYGKSTQMSLESFQNNTHAFDGNGTRGAVVGALRGGALGAGFAIGSAAAGIVKGGGKLLAKGLVAMMRDDAALSREKDWYDLMGSVFQEVFLQ